MQLNHYELIEKFENEISCLKSTQEHLSFEINNLEMSLNHLKYEEWNRKGKCEKEFEDSLKELKILEASYHGGALNVNDMEKIFFVGQIFLDAIASLATRHDCQSQLFKNL